MPPSRLISESGKEWKPMFGLYWSPDEYSIIQKLGLTALDGKVKPGHVQAAIEGVRSMREHWGAMGLAIGWCCGLAFGLLLR